MSTNQKRVLIVDDDQAMLEATAMFVEALGHFPDTASTVEEALAKLDRCIKFDTVLTDFRMPGIRGDEFAKEIKKRSPSMTIVLMSGQVDQICATDVFRTLPKPFTLAQLDSVISWMC